jgi:hypothetical protein
MTSVVNVWGSAILVCLTVVLGVLWNNSRLSDLRSSIGDLRSYMDARFNAQDKRIDDLRSSVVQRIDDLRDFVKSEIRRLEERTSLIHPGR